MLKDDTIEKLVENITNEELFIELIKDGLPDFELESIMDLDDPVEDTEDEDVCRYFEALGQAKNLLPKMDKDDCHLSITYEIDVLYKTYLAKAADTLHKIKKEFEESVEIRMRELMALKKKERLRMVK